LVHDDLVERAFAAERVNQLWLTDITERPTGEGKLHRCEIEDACSRRIVGYSLAEPMTAQLAVDALDHAVLRRRPTASVVYPDHGRGAGPAPS
jgi:transposase InsO family protein